MSSAWEQASERAEAASAKDERPSPLCSQSVRNDAMGEIGCHVEATMAVRTTAPSALRTQVFWDVTDAPKAADLLCEVHGTALLTSLAKTLGRQS